MERETEAIKRAILTSGLDDWVHIAEIAAAARQARFGEHVLDGYPDDETVHGDELARLRAAWLAQREREALPSGIIAIKELLRAGLVRVGDTIDGRFVPWQGSSPEIESRIDTLVRDAEYPLLPGHLFWLENTSLGDEIAAV